MALRYLFALVFCALAPLAAQAQPQTFRDCPECPAMVSIPPGSFTMGVPEGEEEREGVPQEFRGASAPQTPITFARGFALGRVPVTREQFAAFVAATGYGTSTSCGILDGAGFAEREGHSWRSPGFAQTDGHPVVCVSWDDAQAYVAWLSRRTRQTYRLPSEAEWEYAARAGTTGPRYWDGGLEQTCRYANVADDSFRGIFGFPPDLQLFPCQDGHRFTSPVGVFLANRFGLHDMLGNAWQWTSDCWNPTLRASRRTGPRETLVTVPFASFAAVPGAAIRGTSAPATAAGAPPGAASPSPASASPEPNNFLRL